MGCTSGCVKFCLISINIIFAIGSILLIALGAVFIGSGPSILIYLFFAVGGVGLIAAFLGCCGTCQEHICMTTAYATLTFITLIIQIGGMVFASSLDGVRKFADDDITKLWNEEIVSPGAMDFPQETYHCCGKDSPNDYLRIQRDYPQSCYPSHHVNQTTLYTTGCIERAEKVYIDMVRGTISGTWVSIAFTVIMLLFSIYLIVRFRRKQRHYNY